MGGTAKPGKETELETPVNEGAEKSASFFISLFFRLIFDKIINIGCGLFIDDLPRWYPLPDLVTFNLERLIRFPYLLIFLYVLKIGLKLSKHKSH